MHPQNLPREMARRGRIPTMGPLPRDAKAPADSSKRELFDAFLEEITLDFNLDYAPLTGVVIPAGRSAWYGVKRFSIDRLGSDVIWCGHSIVLSPLNQGASLFGAGTYNNLAIQYGGRGAVLMVGPNLPCTEGAWTDGPAMPFADGYSGISAGAGGRSLNMQQARRFYFAGDPNEGGNSHARLIYRERTLPAGVFIPRGQYLDVALVVGRGLVSGLTQTPGVAFEQCTGELTVIRQAAKTARTQ